MPYLLSKPNLLSIFGDEVNDFIIDDIVSLFEKNGGIEKEIVLSFLCSGILPLDVIRMPRMNKKNDFVHVPVRIIETEKRMMLLDHQS